MTSKEGLSSPAKGFEKSLIRLFIRNLLRGLGLKSFLNFRAFKGKKFLSSFLARSGVLRDRSIFMGIRDREMSGGLG